jgi:TRAP-type mannitol/chloroaromatic compound transport system substrate-binding protein
VGEGYFRNGVMSQPQVQTPGRTGENHDEDFAPKTRERRGLASPGAVAAPALAQNDKRRRMVTSWLKRLPGPGMSAERVAERIGALSGSHFDVTVSAAGELVPPFERLDAVGSGVAHRSVLLAGQGPVAAFFTTVPFGLTSNEHVAWIDAGGGQALKDEVYAPFGVKPYGRLVGETR